MSRESFDCLKRERDIYDETAIHSQNTAFILIPALRIWDRKRECGTSLNRRTKMQMKRKKLNDIDKRTTMHGKWNSGHALLNSRNFKKRNICAEMHGSVQTGIFAGSQGKRLWHIEKLTMTQWKRKKWYWRESQGTRNVNARDTHAR